jgi:hypothetical protein
LCNRLFRLDFGSAGDCCPESVRRMQSGLRGFVDGSAVFEEWSRLIEKFERERLLNGDDT